MNKKTLACTALLAAFTLAGTPLMAQDAAATDKPAAKTAAPTAAKPEKMKAKTGGVRFQQCVKENTVVAEAYCANHTADCEAEKKAVTTGCHDEASGKKLTG